MNTNAGSKAILVAGMHRSGTSAATRVLNLLGVELGGNLLAPGPGNRMGHWEHREVVAIHEELLRAFGMGWDDTRALPVAWMASTAADAARERIAALVAQDFSRSALWAVKDPRLCRFLPLWIEVIVGLGIDLRVLFVVRHPAAVAGSLKERDALDPAGTHLRWLEHFAEAEVATRERPRAIILYDDLLSDWRSVMERLGAGFKLRWPRNCVEAAPEIEAFLSADERHNRIGQGAAASESDLTGKLYALCAACAQRNGAWSAISAVVDDYRCWAPVFLGDIDRRAVETGKLSARLRNAEGAAHAKDAQIATRDVTIRDQERKLYGLLETVHGKDLQIQNRDDVIRQKDATAVVAANLARAKEAQIVALGEALAGHAQETGRFAQEASLLRGHITARDAQIVALGEALTGHAQEIGRFAREASLLHARITAQDAEIAARGQVIAAIQATISWRITGPLRAVRRLGSKAAAFSRMLHPIGFARDIARVLWNTALGAGSRARYSSLLHLPGPRARLRYAPAHLRKGKPRPRSTIPVSAFDIRAHAGRRAVILTTRHCEFVAASIQRALHRIGVRSRIIYGMPEGGYEDLPHFVICPQMFEPLPALYVAFQMEQSVSARWFNDRYLRTLERSFAILDYSMANIDALAASGLHRKQFFYLPFGYLPGYGGARMAGKDRYDVLFYGDIHNDRRRRFIEALDKVCHVRVIHDLFGKDLREEIAGAKLIVNIHYYDGALLETTRLWECVSLDKLVVSERAVNMDENGDLEPLVDFVDLNDIDGMVARVRHWLENERARIHRIEANRKLARRSANRFEFFFYRFLLAFDNITFPRFWQLAGSTLELAGDRLCLTLPEYSPRRRSFDQDNRHGFAAFSGLRHHEAWVGCGMSFKLIAMLARKQRLGQITICEDDVEFPPGFEHDFRAVLQELAGRQYPWHVFSGLLADLHADATISSVHEFHGRKLVRTDRLISMVLNVYHGSIFDRLMHWDESDRDVATNTIDRYLERSKLTVIACHPFLVGHKNHLQSTLWNVDNEQMGPMIRRSEQLLQHKIYEFMMSQDPAAAKPSVEVVELSRRKTAMPPPVSRPKTAVAEGGS